MMKFTLIICAVVVLMTAGAYASPIIYDFTVTATFGPLNGDVANGSFTYDSNSVFPGGENANSNLLTSLSFTWDNIAYDQTSANTGALLFDAMGQLTFALFGDDWIPGNISCNAMIGKNDWYVFGGEFLYSTPTGFGVGSTTLTPSMPEPSTILAMLAGLVLVGAWRLPIFRRFRAQRSHII